ncbi:MAG: hypothetical protein ACLRRT_02095 [Ruthenibacterium lactatiformans]
MVHFVGAGPGAPDLITQRARRCARRGRRDLRGQPCQPALLGLAGRTARCTTARR